MLKRGIVTLAALSILLAGSAFAGKKSNNGSCKDQFVVGSYTRVDVAGFTDGYGNFQDRIYARQLNLNTGGTVHQIQSFGPDLHIISGLGSPWTGSWKCRKDGKLLVTVLSANYAPTPPGAIFPGSPPDIELIEHLRTTYLFSVEDNNTLKLIQAVARFYNMTEDPSDPNAGILGPEFFDEYYYDRLIPSDADLTP